MFKQKQSHTEEEIQPVAIPVPVKTYKMEAVDGCTIFFYSTDPGPVVVAV